MAYFPDTQFEHIAQNNEPITAAAKQGGELIIFKTHSTFAVSYEFDGTDVYHPLREFNAGIGCDMAGSVQLIDNNLVFANTYGGAYTIVSTAGKSEDTIKPISGNINGTRLKPGLLQESGLTDATSIDYNRKYWLCVNDKVYMWDYDIQSFYGYLDYEKAQRRLSWFKLSNISAAAWYGTTSDLYHATSTRIVRFHRTVFADFGQPIAARWKSKAFDLGAGEYYKTVLKIYPSLRFETNSSAVLDVATDAKDRAYTKEIEVRNFNWAYFTWSAFSWNVNRYTKTFALRAKLKKITYVQFTLTNNIAHRDMAITGMMIEFFTTGKVK